MTQNNGVSFEANSQRAQSDYTSQSNSENIRKNGRGRLYMVWISLLLVIGGMLAIMTLPIFAGGKLPSNATSSIECGNWHLLDESVMTSEVANINSFGSVLALGQDDVWFAGSDIDSLSKGSPLFTHWNGKQLQLSPALDLQAKSGEIKDMASVGSHEFWAVGSVDDGSNTYALAILWKNGVWSRTEIPAPPIPENVPLTKGNEYTGTITSSTRLNSVAALSENNVWAVGEQVIAWNSSNNTVDSVMHTLIAHWDGQKWELIESPDDLPRDSALTAIVPISSNDMWAFGYSEVIPNFRSIHWDGIQWQVAEPLTFSKMDQGSVSSAAVSLSNALWIVGEYDSGVWSQVLNKDTQQWVSHMGPAITARIEAVVALLNGQVWAFGEKSRDVPPSAGYAPMTHKAVALRWDGTNWDEVDVPRPLAIQDIYDVSSDPTDGIWITGLAAASDDDDEPNSPVQPILAYQKSCVAKK
jgi:hypothetical protein